VLFLENNGKFVSEGIVYVIWYQHGMVTTQHRHSASPSLWELSNNKTEVRMAERLSNYEKETIITFNKAEDVAHIFTYEKTWQKHLERKLGLKPVMDNGFGGKDYEIAKKRIRPPRAPVRLSAETRAKLTKRMKDMSQRLVVPSQTAAATTKSARKNQPMVNTSQQLIKTRK
jgi:hypothetical protein